MCRASEVRQHTGASLDRIEDLLRGFIQACATDIDLGLAFQAGEIIGEIDLCCQLRKLILHGFDLGSIGCRRGNYPGHAHQGVAAICASCTDIRREVLRICAKHGFKQALRQYSGLLACNRLERTPLNARFLARTQLRQILLALFFGQRYRLAAFELLLNGSAYRIERLQRSGLVFEQTCRHQGVGSDFDGFGIALVFQYIVRKQRLQHFRICQQAAVAHPYGLASPSL